MDFIFYRDVAEIALNNFKIQDNYGNADIVLNMYDSIKDLIFDCLDARGYMQTHNFLVDGLDAVYRRLNVIAKFLSELKPLHLLAFKNLDRFRLTEIKWTIKDILEAIAPHVHTYLGFEKGFQRASDVYVFSYDVPYSSIGKFLLITLDFVEDFGDLTEWRPPSLLLYYKFLNVDLDIKPDMKFITLSEKYIETPEYNVHDEACIELSLFLETKGEVPPMDAFDWTFELFESFQQTAIVYVYSACNTVDKLLEVAQYFQRKVAIKQSFSHCSIMLIYKMCNALLFRGFLCRKNLNRQNLIDLLNIVFSVVDRLIPETIITNSNNRSFIESIYEELTLTISLCPKYDKLLLQFDTSDPLNYYDVIFKFFFMYFHKHRDILVVNLREIITIIHRPFLPNAIGLNREHWNSKFKRYSNLNEVLLHAESDLCTICEKDIILEPTEIAILERCNHLCCSKCLMENLNVITNGTALEFLPESFHCPTSSCEMCHTGFVTDGQYDRLRTEAMEAMYDLD